MQDKLSNIKNSLQRTPLDSLHRNLDAKLVPYAGYEMPVQYLSGIMEEHLFTRASASLFDISHMGQISIYGKDRAGALERIVPGNICGLVDGRTRYTQITNRNGGIIDDLMITNNGDHLLLVVNAVSKKRVILSYDKEVFFDFQISILEVRLRAILRDLGSTSF